jgi:hypothetical protein
MKQFDVPLQQGSQARIQFDILSLQQGSSAHSCMQFGILPLQQGSNAYMQFDILPLHQGCSVHLCMQFGIQPLHYIDCRARLPDNKATDLRPDNYAVALHAYWHALCRPRSATLASFQTAYKRSAVTVMQWQDTKLHARMRAAALLQWQNIKLLNWLKDMQQQQQQQQQQQSKMYTRGALQALAGKNGCV